jgi:hypothetical protein
VGGNLEKVRDLLFGAQMRDMENHFARLEERSTIPANGPYTLCDDDVGAICGRSDINLTLLSMPKRLNRSAGRAENRPQASSEHTSPVATGNRRVVRLASQTDE